METLNEYKIERGGKVPVNAIVVSKFKEWIHDVGVSKVVTEFGVTQAREIKWFGKKDEATEMIVEAIDQYMDRHEMYPPGVSISRKFKNGNYELVYAPNKYDKFKFTFDQSWFEDIDEYMESLDEYSPSNAPEEWLTEDSLNSKKPNTKRSNKKASPKTSDPWSVEPAKSSRSSCRTCKNKIAKGELRIGEPTFFEDKKSFRWHHAKCAKPPVTSAKNLEGFSSLTKAEKAILNKTMKK